MFISIIIPTYKRSDDLLNCLVSLTKQVRLADEVIVILRDTDYGTIKKLNQFNEESVRPIKEFVKKPGQVVALNNGLKKAKGDIIAILDDDTMPHTDWLSNIEKIFKSDEKVGGVGGRDWMYKGKVLQEGKKKLVGKVQWFGRVIGNHHLGFGSMREVDVIKGANMSFRKEAIKNITFDERLLGHGAQVHNDMAFSLEVRKRGWKIIYDPRVSVDHYLAPRFDEDKRDSFNETALFNAVFNHTLILLEYYHGNFQRAIFILWSIFVGTYDKPGFIQWLRLKNKRKEIIDNALQTNIKGRIAGLKYWQTHTKY